MQFSRNPESVDDWLEQGTGGGERRFEALWPAHFWGGTQFISIDHEIGAEFSKQVVHVVDFIPCGKPAAEPECVLVQAGTEAGQHVDALCTRLQPQGAEWPKGRQRFLP